MHRLLETDLLLRLLQPADAGKLGDYFDTLSARSKSRFQPHPLTRKQAAAVCASDGVETVRLVIEHSRAIIGYFILEPRVSVHEVARYREHGIMLQPGLDFMFAPSMGDAFQNRGIASSAMPHVIDLARGRGARSLVLMGGTQATNARAIAFYEKFGFRRFGGYQTEVFNHDMRLVLDRLPVSRVGGVTAGPG